MKNKKVRVIAGCGMLTAAAVVLQYLEFPIPIVPSFIKLYFSDLPELDVFFRDVVMDILLLGGFTVIWQKRCVSQFRLLKSS